MDYPKRGELRNSTGNHLFMVPPGCPYPLLGQVLLTKMGAQIHFSPKGLQVLDKHRPLHMLRVTLDEE